MTCDVVATGSYGNAVVLNEKVLIDCGTSYKKLQNYVNRISLVLLTHIHSDHFNKTTVKRIAKERPKLRFCCCKWLVKPLVEAGVPTRNIDVLEIGKKYRYSDSLAVSPVKLYHNVEQCGWRIYIENEKAIYMTDTQTVEGISAKGYDLYLIEANYEDAELQKRIAEKMEQGEFAYEIQVPYRHLSKAQADKFIEDNKSENSRFIYLHQHKEKGNG